MATHEALQKSLDKNFKPIRFSKTNKRPLSLARVIDNYFFKRYMTFDENGEQCSNGRSRSKEDFYLLLKGYDPNVTLRETAEIMKALKKSKVIVGDFCSDVGRVVYDSTNMNHDVNKAQEALANVEGLDLNRIENAIRTAKTSKAPQKKAKQASLPRKSAPASIEHDEAREEEEHWNNTDDWDDQEWDDDDL